MQFVSTLLRRLISVVLLGLLGGADASHLLGAETISEKLKAEAARNLKTAGLDGYSFYESNSFLIASTLPEAKAKAVAEQLERIAATAMKALQMEPMDTPWKDGKLLVYLFDDNRPFRIFMLTVVKERTNAPYHLALRADPPYILRASSTGSKSSDAELIADTGRLLASALLSAKAGSGTTLPEWFRFGFGRAVVARSAGITSRAMTELRTKARMAITMTGAKAEEAWTTQNEVIDASVMDYLAFSPAMSANFPKLVQAMRADENGNVPDFEQVLMSALMTSKDDFDKAWKKYVMTGR